MGYFSLLIGLSVLYSKICQNSISLNECLSVEVTIERKLNLYKNTKKYKKMLRLIGYLCFLMLFLTACHSNDKEDSGDDFPEFSEEQLQEMLKNHPKNQANQVKSTEAIIEQMETLLLQDPNNLTTHYNVAKLYHQQFAKDSLEKNCLKAIEHYSHVINQDASYEKGHAYYNRMLCYLHTKQLEAALEDIDHFVEVNQKRTPVNYKIMRAEILYQQGKKQAACEDYLAALNIAQKDSLPIENEQEWLERCSN